MAAKQEQNQAAINEIATNKAELETTEGWFDNSTSRTRMTQVALGAELATAQDEKTSLVSAKSTAESVAASTLRHQLLNLKQLQNQKRLHKQ